VPILLTVSIKKSSCAFKNEIFRNSLEIHFSLIFVIGNITFSVEISALQEEIIVDFRDNKREKNNERNRNYLFLLFCYSIFSSLTMTSDRT